MQKNFQIANRIIDANINRAKEGLRVCEEIARFALNSRSLTTEFKKIRHNIDLIVKKFPNKDLLILQRQSSKDAGKRVFVNELKRNDIADIFLANFKRVIESLRVLEEFSKLYNTGLAIKFKNLRYYSYELEKKIIKKIPALCNHK